MRPKRYPLDKPTTRDRAIAWLVEGKSSGEVVALLKAHRIDVSSAAVRAFRRRHAAEIAELAGRVRDAIQEATIADKVARMRFLDEHAHAIDAAIKAEGYFKQEVHYLGKGEEQEKYTLDTFDYPRVKALLDVLRAAAEEQGDIIRRSETVVSGGQDAAGATLPVPIRII